MRAVREAAALGDQDQIVENLGDADARLRQLELAHPRRVEQPAPALQPVHRTRGGRVAPGIVAFADRLGGDAVRTAQRVDQRRFADARGAEQRDGLPRAAIGGEPCGAGGVAPIDRLDPQAGFDRTHGCGKILWRVGQVDLGEHDDGIDPDFTRQHKIALQPRHAEILVARRDDEQRVDIGGDHLLPARVTRCPSFEQVPPPENTGRLLRGGVDQQPIADGRMIVRGGRSRNIRRNRETPARTCDGDLTAMDRHHADRPAALRFLLGKLVAEKGGPAQFVQRLVGRCHGATRHYHDRAQYPNRG